MRIKLLLLLVFYLSSCDSKIRYVEENLFEGTWELKGRSMFQGITIEITEQDGNFVGRIQKLNDNKYVTMFLSVNDTWVSSIERTSNYSFNLTEKKIGGPLFSQYGLSTSNSYKAEFIDTNHIGLAPSGSDPKKASIIYERIN